MFTIFPKKKIVVNKNQNKNKIQNKNKNILILDKTSQKFFMNRMEQLKNKNKF